LSFLDIFYARHLWIILWFMEENTEKRVRVRRSRAEIDQLLESFGYSGLTQQAFCRERGLCVATFSSWRRKRAESGASAGKTLLRPVRLKEEACEPGAVVRLPGGIEVVLPGGSGAGEIAALVVALKALPEC